MGQIRRAAAVAVVMLGLAAVPASAHPPLTLKRAHSVAGRWLPLALAKGTPTPFTAYRIDQCWRVTAKHVRCHWQVTLVGGTRCRGVVQIYANPPETYFPYRAGGVRRQVCS